MARLFRSGPDQAAKAGDPARIVRIVAGHNEPVWPRLDVVEQQADEYLRSSWVYVAVTRIAEAAALVPYQVFAVDGEAKIAQDNHPLERLLRDPNPFASQFELLEATFGFLELTGNAFWFLAGRPGGIPEEVWLLRPDRVRIVPDTRRFVGGYVYTVDGVDVPLAADEVVHFKRWHPRSDYYGLSALEAAAIASQTDRAMAAWNRNFFSKEKAVPAGIVTIKNMVDDASYERIIREFRETYGGAERRTAFIRGGDITWEDIGLSQKETDFLQARQLNKEEIFHIFGIPPGLLDKNSTQANATVARDTFLSDTIWPKLVRFAQKLSQQLAPFYGPNLLVEAQEIRDTSADVAELQAAGPYLTINEIRQRYLHMDAVAWGDRPGQITSPPAPSPLAERGEFSGGFSPLSIVWRGAGGEV
jgi:HK97 family phage portal protein